jgi:hypothetical protein
MKTFQKIIISCIVFLSLSPAALFAGDEKPGKHKTIQEQIASYINYPDILCNGQAKGATVSFRLTADNRITGVEAQLGDAELDVFLERTLIGKKIKSSSDNPIRKFRVQISFREE